jgi:predicted CoA-binding protein
VKAVAVRPDADAAPPLAYDDGLIRRVLESVRTIAMVGASPAPTRPSHGVMRFLQRKGYRVIPVNPDGGREINGERVYARLAEVPGPIDMVDVFRAPEEAGGVVDEALAVAPEKGIRVVWMQLGVRDDEAARRARAAGLTVIMDRCPAIEYPRLIGH